MSNPNQVWFPHILRVKPYIKIGETEYENPTVWTVEVVMDGIPSKGDEFFTDKGQKLLVKEILDTRPAQGDWTGEFWKGITPLWSKCRCELARIN